VGSGAHDYEVTVYAVDVAHLGVGPDSTLDHVRSAMAGHVLARASMVGLFGR
jgi:phosphatidylethanolamine-binding protein (PEBP) family uncharacterized protein